MSAKIIHSQPLEPSSADRERSFPTDKGLEYIMPLPSELVSLGAPPVPKEHLLPKAVTKENQYLDELIQHIQLEEEQSIELNVRSDAQCEIEDLREEWNEIYEKLRKVEAVACYEIAELSLKFLNSYIFTSYLPSFIKRDAEKDGIYNISQIFAPGVNGLLKNRLIRVLPPRLRTVARIMGHILQKYSHMRDSEDHPCIRKRIAIDLVKTKFPFPKEYIERVCEFINSNPQIDGQAIFVDSDFGDQTGYERIKRKAEVFEWMIQMQNIKMSKKVLELWEHEPKA
ncbi:hypothetical protein BDQ17DRAFT_1522317 [Cyathus striatus]|nr:hypothetical protein BDQ17DRAFT_1522317 [Cyathus striatus]